MIPTSPICGSWVSVMVLKILQFCTSCHGHDPTNPVWILDVSCGSSNSRHGHNPTSPICGFWMSVEGLKILQFRHRHDLTIPFHQSWVSLVGLKILQFHPCRHRPDPSSPARGSWTSLVGLTPAKCPQNPIHSFFAIAEQRRGKERDLKASWGEITISIKHSKGKTGPKLLKA